MSLNNKILLELANCTDGGFKRVADDLVKNKKSLGCQVKQCEGKWYYKPDSCKTKPVNPKPVNPKPKEDKECFWKGDDMLFTCNSIDDCYTTAGDFFRAYVNEQFPEIAKQYKLDKKGTKTFDYCSKTMKEVWDHEYNSTVYPGLVGYKISDIYLNDLKPEAIDMDCKPWDKDNDFINDYTTDDERDEAAFKMVVSFNNSYGSILDSNMMDMCDKTIDNDLGWIEKQKKGLHKHPLVRWIANSTLEGTRFYDDWKKSLVKSESVITNMIERKLNIKKKLKEMKKNKTISENVREKLKISKLDRKLNLKENSKFFFNESYRKFFDNYFNTKVLKSLNESELEDFDIAFNSVFGGHEEAFIEKGIQYILNKLQIDPNSDMGKKISDRFKSLPNEEAKKMIDPQYVSETIVSILPETFIDVSDPSGDGLETIVKNTIAKLAASRTTLDDLTHQISQKVKQSLEDLKNTTIETSSDMKKSYIEKLKSSI